MELWLSRASGLIAQLIIWGMEGEARMNALTHFPLSPLALWGSEENLVTDTQQVRLATALFPVVSLLNHSCSPNTSVSFFGTVATIRASQLIRRGQEISHCYGEPPVLPTAHPSPAESDGVSSHGQATKQVPFTCPGRVCLLVEAVQSSLLGPVVSTPLCISLLDPCKHPILKMDWEQLLGFFFFLSPWLGSLFL